MASRPSECYKYSNSTGNTLAQIFVGLAITLIVLLGQSMISQDEGEDKKTGVSGMNDMLVEKVDEEDNREV